MSGRSLHQFWKNTVPENLILRIEMAFLKRGLVFLVSSLSMSLCFFFLNSHFKKLCLSLFHSILRRFCAWFEFSSFPYCLPAISFLFWDIVLAIDFRVLGLHSPRTSFLRCWRSIGSVNSTFISVCSPNCALTLSILPPSLPFLSPSMCVLVLGDECVGVENDPCVCTRAARCVLLHLSFWSCPCFPGRKLSSVCLPASNFPF